jgi:hypothetical protein
MLVCCGSLAHECCPLTSTTDVRRNLGELSETRFARLPISLPPLNFVLSTFFHTFYHVAFCVFFFPVRLHLCHITLHGLTSTMRVFLTILRNGLPPSEIVWALPEPETSPSGIYTIAKLLKEINECIPLESDHWGLEDYVVEVGEFECIHYQSARRLLKEDDHVLYVLFDIISV